MVNTPFEKAAEKFIEIYEEPLYRKFTYFTPELEDYHTEWESLLSEPVIGLHYFNSDPGDMGFKNDLDAIQFNLSKQANIGFETTSGIPFDVELDTEIVSMKELLYAFLETLAQREEMCPIFVMAELPDHIKDFFHDNAYFSNYSEAELMKAYEVTSDSRFLPTSAKEIFLF